eukprot:gnl/MRDRNA2_/MRDRNA2_75539_c0_seq1.p1 gnl/MRDRNA2_/MRDRNA2_75539_c0~~gnl/MRDRNA2_/MRDRNA2_75539_c0_seq1.p1  ORF type:complete len:114 (+),score=14.04 gnl/MRDRNA2_/MRDRNA2_75539_c0_seq1:342-683(+)
MPTCLGHARAFQLNLDMDPAVCFNASGGTAFRFYILRPTGSSIARQAFNGLSWLMLLSLVEDRFPPSASYLLAKLRASRRCQDRRSSISVCIPTRLRKQHHGTVHDGRIMERV